VLAEDLPEDKARALYDRIERAIEKTDDLPWL
jgi:hypothetical protein